MNLYFLLALGALMVAETVFFLRLTTTTISSIVVWVGYACAHWALRVVVVGALIVEVV